MAQLLTMGRHFFESFQLPVEIFNFCDSFRFFFRFAQKIANFRLRVLLKTIYCNKIIQIQQPIFIFGKNWS